jgi:flagellar biosynthesis/type III secretory pathway chaperone
VHREALFTALANEDGYRGKVDIDYLAKKLPENDRGALEALRDKYKEVVRELSALNKLNQNLLRTQLQYTSFCIDAIMQQSEPVTGTYASSGQISTGGGTPRRLIEREA